MFTLIYSEGGTRYLNRKENKKSVHYLTSALGLDFVVMRSINTVCYRSEDKSLLSTVSCLSHVVPPLEFVSLVLILLPAEPHW